MTSPGGPGELAWERGTARVLHGGQPVGVAFLIPGRLLLTCAHVISTLAGLPDDRPLPARFPVNLDFPLLPGRPAAEAAVHFRVPVAADNSGDVALLQPAGPPPPGAVPMRTLEADDLAGHRWRAFGFPRYPGADGGKDAGVWTRGTIEGRGGTGWWQLTCDERAPFPPGRRLQRGARVGRAVPGGDRYRRRGRGGPAAPHRLRADREVARPRVAAAALTAARRQPLSQTVAVHRGGAPGMATVRPTIRSADRGRRSAGAMRESVIGRR
ncbi:trypsin-like peptidase domain-containing protein [Streptomyces sp. NPDC059564]|uniref:trypsin-like peptidase domain-containing protein n=1 Tax=Streptomyces sp. NPDC059564 TaxID=3346865 RepID=UPI0036C92BBC